MCANPCPTGTYHIDCKKKCDCYNGAVCDHVNGKCHCLPGYKGTKVSELDPFWPAAHDKLTCRHFLCMANDAFALSGLFQCQEQCPYGRYGHNCQQLCRCQNGGTCDPIDGRCTCPPGWQGPLCNQRSCSRPELYGPHCSLICRCHPNNTEM